MALLRYIPDNQTNQIDQMNETDEINQPDHFPLFVD
jgi:hypothetical protein